MNYTMITACDHEVSMRRQTTGLEQTAVGLQRSAQARLIAARLTCTRAPRPCRIRGTVVDDARCTALSGACLVFTTPHTLGRVVASSMRQRRIRYVLCVIIITITGCRFERNISGFVPSVQTLALSIAISNTVSRAGGACNCISDIALIIDVASIIGIASFRSSPCD